MAGAFGPRVKGVSTTGLSSLLVASPDTTARCPHPPPSHESVRVIIRVIIRVMIRVIIRVHTALIIRVLGSIPENIYINSKKYK